MGRISAREARQYKLGEEVSGRRALELVRPVGIPAWHRPRTYRGLDACDACDGYGWTLTLEAEQPGRRNRRVGEKPCEGCDGTGDRRVLWRKREAVAPAYFAKERQDFAKESAKWTPGFSGATETSEPWRFGWGLANKIFSSNGSFLRDEDQVIDWLYKIRAVLGVVILVAAGVRYHQPTQGIIAYFKPVIGEDNEPIFLIALASVLPATLAVILFTRREKRVDAFRQMVRYPIATALISVAIYGCFEVAIILNGSRSSAVRVILVIAAVAFSFSCFLFLFRSVYLLTVDMWRLGDGHPLLPPVIGSLLAWLAAFFFSGPAGAGEPAEISAVILFGGSVSVTIVGIVEVARLRARYPSDFPFRNGPLPPRNLPTRP